MSKGYAAALRAATEAPPEPGTRGEGDVWKPPRGGKLSVDGSMPVGAKPKFDPHAAYSPAVGCLPDAELKRLLRKHLTNRMGGLVGKSDEWTMGDVARLACVDHKQVKCLKQGLDMPVYLTARVRISQVILRIEGGLLEKKAGVVTVLTEPRKPMLPPMTRRVLLDSRGRVMIVAGDAPPAPRPFPEMMKAWLKN